MGERYVYGYGRTKHIYGQTIEVVGWRGRVTPEDFGLCGAAGGHPDEQPERPTCKRCLSIASKAAS